MESNDYRLERWMAILLALLFFLPFVARADDVVFTGIYHGDEMPYPDGAPFLAMTEDGVLVPVKIVVTPERDLYDAPDQNTAKRVSVDGLDFAFLLRGANLHPGKIESAEPNFLELIPAQWKASIAFNGETYQLSYRCAKKQCTLVLAGGGVTQGLVTVDAEMYEGRIRTADIVHVINFAGDLDHDGKLDLIGDLSRDSNGTRTTLWLSSAAKEGQLVGLTAERSTTGC